MFKCTLEGTDDILLVCTDYESVYDFIEDYTWRYNLSPVVCDMFFSKTFIARNTYCVSEAVMFMREFDCNFNLVEEDDGVSLYFREVLV